MFSFLIIAAAYWIFCTLWFVIVQKSLFLLYNHRESAGPMTLRSYLAALRHGVRTDMIIASYLTAIPLIAGATAAMITSLNVPYVLLVYNILIGLIVGLISTADTLLYRFWKYKIDSSVFAYMRSFKGATASVSAGYLIAGVAGWLAVSATFTIGSQLTVLTAMAHSPLVAATSLPIWGYPGIVLAVIVVLGLLFLIIRGTGIRPNSPSIAFFSNNPFLNHLALNPAYSLIYSMSRHTSLAGQFNEMDSEECDQAIDRMFPHPTAPGPRLLRTERPDIMLVIWESFGAEFAAAFGGRKETCPNFDRIATDAIRFTNCTAGSFRTDRGLVNLLSGYPAQPTLSIIQHTRKLPGLPGLPRTLRNAGYITEAIHGGDLSIMNKNDYYLASGHSRLIDQSAFPPGAPKGKWGVHDEAAMMLAADEAIRLHDEGQPFMITLQTLSSHEPFDVPYNRLSDRPLNSFAYTDMALGKMVDRLKNSAAWQNLLLIVVADHGFNASMLPDNRLSYAHIPLIMTGGAVKLPTVVDTIMSQTDLAATLLSQMNLPHNDFIFSRDILSSDYRDPFGLHIFNNGVMINDGEGYTVWDTMLRKVIEGDDSPRRINLAKAILQKIYSDLDQR